MRTARVAGYATAVATDILTCMLDASSPTALHGIRLFCDLMACLAEMLILSQTAEFFIWSCVKDDAMSRSLSWLLSCS